MTDQIKKRIITLSDINVDDELFQQMLEELRSYIKAYDLDISDDVLEKCLLHLQYVIQVNQYINLTRITDDDEAIVLHILDSLLLSKYLPCCEGRLLDMGTGAGFPGIPLCIAFPFEGTLLDSVGKKINAVNAFAQKLGLNNVHGVHDRLESFANSHQSKFDIVVARALASLPVLIEYAAPFISQGGYMVLAKGVPTEDEMASGLKVAALCGFDFLQREDFELPANFGHRSVFIFEKVSKSKVKLPRSVGAAKKSPLA